MQTLGVREEIVRGTILNEFQHSRVGSTPILLSTLAPNAAALIGTDLQDDSVEKK